MRINQYIAAATGTSRRGADSLISEGRVKVNGRAATLGTAILAGDLVELDGQTLQTPKHHTYLQLHKPVGYICSRRRQSNSPTIYEIIPAEYASLKIAGRLDKDSSGLVLLSDDGQVLFDMSHPSQGKTKEYMLQLAKPLSQTDLQALESGVPLDDGPSKMKILQNDGTNVTVELGEGRNRQIRRTFAALGNLVQELHRTRLGQLQLGELAPGEFKLLERL